MIFLCGALALLSVMLTALNRQWLAHWAGSMGSWLNVLLFKVAAIPISIFGLFLVYWLLPNRKVPPARVLPAATVVGVLLEVMMYVHLELEHCLASKIAHESCIFQRSLLI